MPSRGLVLRPRAVALAAAVLLLLNVAVIAAAVHLTHSSNDEDKVISRADLIADLLAWLPETDQTRRSFAVWTGASNPARLAMAPAPLTLGHSSEWRARYGYGAEDVTAWAVAGRDSSISVLKGSFDWGAIERSLLAAGYRESTYHRTVIFTSTSAGPSDAMIQDGDSSGAAKAVALLDRRLVLGADAGLVRAAIDAAQGRSAALADVPAIAHALVSLQPLTGLMAISQGDQAIECGVGRGWTLASVQPDVTRYVIVAYGSLGAGGQPRTLVALTFADESTAEGALPAYDEGWRAGFANAGGSGGQITAFGTVSNVSRNHAMLVAELVNGTENGWTRAGVRFAVAVCAPSAGALPPGTPVASATPVQ